MSKDRTLDLFGEAESRPARAAPPGKRSQRGRPPAPVPPEAPLADRMRPRTLDEVVGQPQPLAADGFLRRAVAQDRVPSMVFWGPPGCGKTTLAFVIAAHSEDFFVSFSAVLGGIKEVRARVAEAKARRRLGQRTILFVDEIHRFNKAQQDAFLPHVEKGTVTLIGATTENPSFALNSALLSRCRVVKLEPLSVEDIKTVVHRALADVERGLGGLDLEVDEGGGSRTGFTTVLAELADGDARRALNLLEQSAQHLRERGERRLDAGVLRQVIERAPLRYDRKGDAHYDIISAFIKSMRGSDPDAALYYAARMMAAGEDPLFILRRILIFASEDVGNADPRALQVALAAHQAFERLGMPEGVLPIAQAITYCASAPKSNAAYKGWLAASADAESSGSVEIPMHLRNAPTGLMKSLGYGRDYRYPHDHSGHFVREDYLPEELRGRRYYRPGEQGEEAAIKARLRDWWGEPEGDEE